MLEKLFAAKDQTEARQLADIYEVLSGLSGLTLIYKETRGFTPGAVFVFECHQGGRQIPCPQIPCPQCPRDSPAASGEPAASRS